VPNHPPKAKSNEEFIQKLRALNSVLDGVQEKIDKAVEDICQYIELKPHDLW
jgi:hypothetical protein